MVHAWRGTGKTYFALGVAYAAAGGGQQVPAVFRPFVAITSIG
jgi:hypothetical protein